MPGFGPMPLRPSFRPNFPRSWMPPVWWPAGFVPPEKEADAAAVAVVATYAGAAPDLLLADMPLGAMAEEAQAACRERFGLTLMPAFLDGGACVITGRFGQGRYVLSHAHLETPASPAANVWLSHLLGCFAGGNGFGRVIPPWEPEVEPVRLGRSAPGRGPAGPGGTSGGGLFPAVAIAPQQLASGLAPGDCRDFPCRIWR